MLEPKYVLIILGALGSAACLADEPAAPVTAAGAAPAPALVATAPAPASSPAATASAAGSAPDKSKDVTVAQDKSLRSRGYKPKVRAGTTVYCRKETALGSHFENEICATPDQLELATQSGKDTLNDLQMHNNVTQPKN